MIAPHEELVTLADAVQLVPRTGGKRVHFSTLWRWALRGVRGHRLEHVRVGRTICTSREALNRFFHALADQPAEPTPVARPTPRWREVDSRRSKQILDEAGI